MTYKEKLQIAKKLKSQAYQLEAEADKEKRAEIAKGDIEGWLDYEFESSTGLTEEFAQFSLQMKKHLQKIMRGYTMLKYNRGHFEFFSFFRNDITKKIVYITCSDVRYWQNGWYNDLWIRMAENEKDYTGGGNNKTTLLKLKSIADRLTN